MEWICLLLPACVALSIQKRRNKWEKRDIEQVLLWAKWVITINMLTMVAVLCFFGFSEILTESFQSFSFALKYLCLSLFFAIVVPYVIEVFRKYIGVSLEIGCIDENK